MDVMGAPIQGTPQPSEKRTPAKHQFERPKNGRSAAAGYSGFRAPVNIRDRTSHRERQKGYLGLKSLGCFFINSLILNCK